MSFPVRTILIISSAERGVPFIQFGGIDAFNTGRFAGDDTDMVAEFSGENGRKDTVTFTEQQREEFRSLGFEPIGEEALTWGRNFTWPTPTTTIKEIVRACVIRLRDIGGIQSPDQLCYKAWRYSEKPREFDDRFCEELDPGDDDLQLPELGIPHE
ncbi:MAG: hypothetical protein HG423_005785 [Propionibacterium sp.]|nr:hypothetical protein [Propionibacterium sp.]